MDSPPVLPPGFFLVPVCQGGPRQAPIVGDGVPAGTAGHRGGRGAHAGARASLGSGNLGGGDETTPPLPPRRWPRARFSPRVSAPLQGERGGVLVQVFARFRYFPLIIPPGGWVGGGFQDSVCQIEVKKPGGGCHGSLVK